MSDCKSSCKCGADLPPHYHPPVSPLSKGGIKEGSQIILFCGLHCTKRKDCGQYAVLKENGPDNV